MSKKLYRSDTNIMLTGVLGGVAEYLEIDATLVRLGYVIAMIFSAIFPLVLLYIAAAIIIPKKGETND
ncbi:phage shock protein C (PspC) family protein [Amphibacillus marinus]|uniref:Phage shock protein C (PspC) family protein n=1 Tax=Amphibacillus marinus TaxID=872970 RepID=A0A1H8RSJ4_9BACI|nr:PspC domain-containing protein [Amphibacillus marinus]SEO68913.1 phage shock protein C (PspC) family protein [Amphibacillus marinus]